MTDSFKKTAADYKPAGGKGAFKNRSVGASDILREMQRQFNPVNEARKRNAAAIYATQLRHLSATERAQNQEEQSRRVVQDFENEKMDNVQKWQRDAISKLEKYKTGGYEEIMSRAIKMSPFSQWAGTLIKAGTQLAQAGFKYGVGQHNLQAGYTSKRNDALNITNTNNPDSGVDATATEQSVQTLENNIEQAEVNDLATGNGEYITKDHNQASQNSADQTKSSLTNNSLTAAWKNKNYQTLGAIENAKLEVHEAYNAILEENDRKNLNPGMPGYKTRTQAWRIATATVLKQYDVGADYTAAGEKFIDDLLHQRNLYINREIENAYAASIVKPWNTLNAGLNVAETKEDVMKLYQDLTAPGSVIINPGTKTGYGYTGGKQDALIYLHGKLLTLGKHELAHQLAHEVQPVDIKGKVPPGGKKSFYELHEKSAFGQYIKNSAAQSQQAASAQEVGEREVKGKLLLRQLTDREATGEGTLSDVLVKVEAGEGLGVLEKWADDALIQLNGFPNQQAELKLMVYESTQLSKYRSSIYDTADRALERNDVIALYAIYPKIPAGEKQAFATKYLETVDKFGGQSDYAGTRSNVKAFLVTTLKRDGSPTQIKSILSLEPTVDTSMRFIGSRVKALVNPEQGEGISVIDAERTALLEWRDMVRDGRDDTNSPYFIVGGADNVNGNNAEFGNGLVTSEFGQKSTQQINSYLDGQPDIRAVLGDTKTNIGSDYLFDTNEVAMRWKAAKDGKGYINLTNDMEVVWKHANSLLPPDEQMSKAEFMSLIWKNQGYPVNELPVDTIDFHGAGKDVNTVGYNSYNKKARNGVVSTQHAIATTSWIKNAISKGDDQVINQGMNPIAIKKYQFKLGKSPWESGNDFRGEWQPNTISSRSDTTYQVGDTVTYGGNQYVSNVIHKSHDVNPAEDPDNWTLIDAKALQKRESYNFMQSQFQGNLEMDPPKWLKKIPYAIPTLDRGHLFWPEQGEDLKNVDSDFINFGTYVNLDSPLLDSIFATER